MENVNILKLLTWSDYRRCFGNIWISQLLTKGCLNFDTKSSRDPRPANILKANSMRTWKFKRAFQALRVARFQYCLVDFLQNNRSLRCWRLSGERPREVAEIWRCYGGSLCRSAWNFACALCYLLFLSGGGGGAASMVAEESFPKPHWITRYSITVIR